MGVDNNMYKLACIHFPKKAIALKWTCSKQAPVISKHILITLKCLNTGTPKTINFPFVPNEK